MPLQTEYSFTLPRGYLDASGQLHQAGRMRLAMAMDEIEALQDPRVQANEAYLPVVLLSRVVTHLEGLPQVTTRVIEGLFASDLVHLEDLYLRLNSAQDITFQTACPQCSAQFQIRVAPLVGAEEDGNGG